MLVYCNGDSFTAGAELADEIIPSWPGFFPDPIPRLHNHAISVFLNSKHEYLQRFVKYDDILNNVKPIITHKHQPDESYVRLNGVIPFLEKLKAWPAKLQQLNPDIEIINAAKGGAGIVGICQRTVLDLMKLQEQNKIPDVVFVQLTSLFRYEVYTDTSQDFMYERPVSDKSYFDKKHWPIVEGVVSAYSFNDFTFKYLYNLCSLNASVKGITGKYPIFLDSLNAEHILSLVNVIEDHLRACEHVDILNDYLALVKHSRIREIDESSMQTFSSGVKLAKCPGLHFAPDVHIKFAEFLSKKYIHKEII